MISAIETELVQVLLNCLPEDQREAKSKQIEGLINGPQIAPQGKVDVVAGQDQVDDLLDSLGF